MHFALTEDQQMIRDAADGFLADAADPAAVRRMIESDEGYDPAVWQRIGSELGWCGVAIPEQHNGLGLGAVELVLIQEQIGRRLLSGPFFATACLGTTLLNEVGTSSARTRYLPGTAQGQMRLSAPLTTSDWSATCATATQQDEAWVLDGRCASIPEGAIADVILLTARLATADLALFAVDRKMLKAQPAKSWDATRRLATIDLLAVPAERIDDTARAPDGLIRASALARLYIAAEQIGGAQQCLDSTVAHVTTRKQFGRAIASFQAVKHRCAEMMVRVEAARSMVYGAAALAAGGAATPALLLECNAAKALASETYFFCAQEAIQLHGGVGFTWEYDAQLHFKRAQASSHWLGTAESLQESIAAAVMA